MKSTILALLLLTILLACFQTTMGGSRQRRGSIGLEGNVGSSFTSPGAASVLNASGLSLLINYNGTSPDIKQAIKEFLALIQNGNSQIQVALAAALNLAAQGGGSTFDRLTAFLQYFQTNLEQIKTQIPAQFQLIFENGLSNIQAFIKENQNQLRQFFNTGTNVTLEIISNTQNQFNSFFQVLGNGFRNILNNRPNFQVSNAANQLLNLLTSGKLNATIENILNRNPGFGNSSLNFQQALQQLQINGQIQVQNSARTIISFFNFLASFPQYALGVFNNFLSLFNLSGSGSGNISFQG